MRVGFAGVAVVVGAVARTTAGISCYEYTVFYLPVVFFDPFFRGQAVFYPFAPVGRRKEPPEMTKRQHVRKKTPRKLRIEKMLRRKRLVNYGLKKCQEENAP